LYVLFSVFELGLIRTDNEWGYYECILFGRSGFKDDSVLI